MFPRMPSVLSFSLLQMRTGDSRWERECCWRQRRTTYARNKSVWISMRVLSLLSPQLKHWQSNWQFLVGFIATSFVYNPPLHFTPLSPLHSLQTHRTLYLFLLYVMIWLKTWVSLFLHLDCMIDLLLGAPMPSRHLLSLPKPERECMEKYIKDSLPAGIIRLSFSPLSAGFLWGGFCCEEG